MIIWRGFGWAVPVIVIAIFIIIQMSLDAMYGAEYYKANEWPKVMAIVIASLLVGGLGYLLNYKKRTVITDAETGATIKSSSHTLFFIPIEFWAILIPILMFSMEYLSAQDDAQDMAYIESPAVNDKYLVDFTKIFDGTDSTYKFGVMKVSSLSSDGVMVMLSKLAYDKKKGTRKDVSEGKADADSYYLADKPVPFTKAELIELKESDALFSVVR